jgi:hypothetical protein
MVTLSTSLPFEFDHIASRFCESVHSIFQSIRCTACVCSCDALNRVTEEIGNVVLMHLSPSQLSCKSPSQIVPDHTGLDRKTKWYSGSLTGFLKTTSKRARAHSCLFVVKDISGSAAIDYLLQSCADCIDGTTALKELASDKDYDVL